ncbi:MAG: phosphatase PAP2 family protein [Oligoflexia bacterium]|nr:phosphatase PAP2 family protein [Oligoflexia bacterium]
MIPIFSWEFQIIEAAKHWPRTGLFHFLMYNLSDYSTVVYLILVLLVISILKKGYRPVLPLFLLCLLTTLLSEVISRKIFKIIFMRPRPNFVSLGCHESYCWGFISSHTTVSFSVAILLTLYNRKNLYWAFPIAIMISFSRIYLAEHFPLDVIVGAIVGIILGCLVWSIYLRIHKIYH